MSGGIINLTGVPDGDQFEIIKDGVGATPVATVNNAGAGYGTATTTNTYAHNLGFIPIPIGVINFSGFYYPLDYSRTASSGGGANTDFFVISVKIFADITNTYVQTNVTIHTTGADGLNITSSPVKFYLMRRRANQ